MNKTVSLYGGEVHVEMDEVEHVYFWKEKGLPVPGVTTILKVLDKPALVQWAANCAVDHITKGYVTRLEAGEIHDHTSFLTLCQDAKTAHRRISKQATDVGSLVHEYAESVLVDGRAAMPSDPQAAKGAHAFLEWFRSHKIEPIHVERQVLSRTWYYAGTCDFYGRIDDELCVLDFKSSKPFVTKHGGPYTEMHLQLAAYAVAITEEIGERIDTGWIVRLDKQSGKCDPHKIALTHGVKDAWLRVRETHEAIKKVEDQLDGLRKSAA